MIGGGHRTSEIESHHRRFQVSLRQVSFGSGAQLLAPTWTLGGRSPVVFKVVEVRRWVAAMLRRDIDRTESELRLRRAMLAAGMKEPPKDRNRRGTRVKIDGLYHNVVATFDLEDGVTWGQIKEHHKRPEAVAPL